MTSASLLRLLHRSPFAAAAVLLLAVLVAVIEVPHAATAMAPAPAVSA